jgi:ATP-dependent helicase/DNAse subunit B
VPITLITGPANAGKAQVVVDAVRRHLAHGQEPLLIVPTRADSDHYLSELAGERTALGVRVERFEGLIAEATRRAGIGEPALGELARERVIEALAARAGVPASPGSVHALGHLFAELGVRRVTPARFGRALADARVHWSGLGRLFGEYCATIERLGRMDVEQRAVRGLDALRERPALWGATPVLLYGFDDLTPLQIDTIETLGRLVDAPLTVSLTYEPGRIAFAGRAASFHAVASLAVECRQLEARAEHYAPHAREALSHLERSLFEQQAANGAPVDADTAVALLEGGGERAELELVAEQIRALLAQGMAGEDIAVLARPGGISLDLLEEVFSLAGIPFSLSRRRRFGDSALGRALIGLLRCVPADSASAAVVEGGELADLLGWLRAPGLAGGSPADGSGVAAVDRLEISARRAGAHTAEQARALWERRPWPLETIDRFAEAQARGARALYERATRELQWLFAAPRRGRAHVLAGDELDEARALAAGRRALAELAELARSTGELAPRSAAELAGALERLEFFSDARGTDTALGAVAVLDPLALRARRVRALFVCGLQEGVFPGRGPAQPILSDEERARLAEVSGLRLGEPRDTLAAERYLFYAAVSRPQERLFLSWHAADDDGETTSRSLFVDDVCDLFAPSLGERRVRRPLGAVAGITDTNADGAADPRPPSACARRRLEDDSVVASLRARVWSPSSLEQWVGCPLAWFVERMLGPDAFEPDPEPLARGGLAHAALKDTLEGLRRETGAARLRPATLERARELLGTALREHETDYPLSVAPERQVAVRRRLQADLERYLEHAAHSESPLEPHALELGFGFAADDERGEGSELPAVDLGDGVLLRGRIDRVDISAAGDAVVYDYKGRRAPGAARWVRDGDLQVALYMRAVADLLRVPVIGGFYQPLTGEDLRPRGVLDADAGVEVECVPTDVREHADVRELLAGALSAARRAVGEARAGQLDARPQTCAFRGGCKYPSICRYER